MKKILFSMLIASMILFILPTCIAGFDVQPRELYLTMDKEFIEGNTSEIIKIKNIGDSEINVTWYLDNPSNDLIRQNRTTIPDLSWIDLEPAWKVIPENDEAEFFIHLNITEEENYMDQHWEVWIAFKEEDSGFIKFEHAVRFYIDTPSNSKQIDDIILTFSAFVFIPLAIFVFLIIIYFYKKKKKPLH